MTFDEVIQELARRGHTKQGDTLDGAPRNGDYYEVTQPGGPTQFKLRNRELFIGVATHTDRTDPVISFGPKFAPRHAPVLTDFKDKRRFEYTTSGKEDGNDYVDYTDRNTRDVYRVDEGHRRFKMARADRQGVPVFGQWQPLED